MASLWLSRCTTFLLRASSLRKFLVLGSSSFGTAYVLQHTQLCEPVAVEAIVFLRARSLHICIMHF